jgi:hypothetical protein
MRTAVLLIVVLVVAFALVRGDRRDNISRKKIIIEVETPHGLARGESVVEFRPFSVPWWYPVGGNRGGGLSQRGEAAYADLGNGRMVFVALDNQLNQRPIKSILSSGNLMIDGSFRPGTAPMLVTFGDIADATTVSEVGPDSFSITFGPGFRLRRLIAVDTSEGATQGTLAAKFPDLREGLRRAPAQRFDSETWQAMNRGDVRLLQWSALEASDWRR